MLKKPYPPDSDGSIKNCDIILDGPIHVFPLLTAVGLNPSSLSLHGVWSPAFQLCAADDCPDRLFFFSLGLETILSVTGAQSLAKGSYAFLHLSSTVIMHRDVIGHDGVVTQHVFNLRLGKRLGVSNIAHQMLIGIIA